MSASFRGTLQARNKCRAGQNTSRNHNEQVYRQRGRETTAAKTETETTEKINNKNNIGINVYDTVNGWRRRHRRLTMLMMKSRGTPVWSTYVYFYCLQMQWVSIRQRNASESKESEWKSKWNGCVCETNFLHFPERSQYTPSISFCQCAMCGSKQMAKDSTNNIANCFESPYSPSTLECRWHL